MNANFRKSTWLGAVLLCVAITYVPTKAQCPPPSTEQHVRCWASSAEIGSWSNPDNWDPPIVPVADDHVYQFMGGLIVYDVTQQFNQTIASFTAGGTAMALRIVDGLPLTILGNMESNGAVDYALTVKAGADLTVNGEVRDVKVTLESGTSNDETTVHIATDVTGGDWTVPQHTRVTIDGSVYATGQKRWDVGTVVAPNHFPGGIVTILHDVRGGMWHLNGNLPDVEPLPEITVNGTINGGCWFLDGGACSAGVGPKSRWRFHDIVGGPDACNYGDYTDVNVREVGRFCVMVPAPGAAIEGGLWSTDLTLGTGKIASVTGGQRLISPA